MQYKTKTIHAKFDRNEIKILQFLCNISKRVYNRGLANIKSNYETTNRIINKFDNYKQLKNIELSYFINSEMFQKTLYRLNATIDSYFELKKLGLNPNFPSFLNKKYYPIMFSYLGIKKDNQRKYLEDFA